MKVILKKYQENLGDVGDVVKVKDGYAKNYLIPNDIAVEASKGNLKQMELVKKSLQKIEAKNIEEAKKVAEKIKDLEITFKVKTSEEGKLYGSITNKDIAERIAEERNIDVDKKKIALEEHLKEVGSYDVEIKLYKDVRSIVKVNLEGEEEPKAPEEEVEEEEKKEQDNG
ncbi:MAG: 50S ribosomal protein L9 [Actinomycetota bacterium]